MEYFAVDTNYLRIDLLPRLRNGTSNERFILTDTTILETMKGPHWENVAKDSFGPLASHFIQVVISGGVGDLMRDERDTGIPKTSVSTIVDEEVSGAFRLLLAELASGVSGTNLAYARSAIAGAQSDLRNHQLNDSKNAQGLKLAVEDIGNAFEFSKYRRMPDGNQKESARIQGIQTLSRAATELTLVKEGVEKGIAQRLAVSNGICHRQTIGLYCLGWKWALAGSLPQRPEKITNELMDLDQSIIGSYCSDILTRDKGVIALRQDILKILYSTMVVQPPVVPTP